MNTAEMAKGKWRGILLACGIEEKFLSSKHGPCPMCGGVDRYRFDNRDGRGMFYCSQCGAGDGFKFLQMVKGWDFKTTAKEVDKLVGKVEAEPTPKLVSDEDMKLRLRRLWKGSFALMGEDPVSRYLIGRNAPSTAGCLRFHPKCPVPHGGGYAEAMLALVTNHEGKPVNIHRTILGPVDGKRLRATMQGALPDGSAIRLSPVHGVNLGIAEGIETALRASQRFGMPVWAALNATMLSKWIAPKGVKHVTIFGDCDHGYGGQAAAYTLAHRLAVRCKLSVDVKIPDTLGRDWADSDAA